MDIIDSLKFVRGAVSTKDLVPEMKHFAIQDGTVRAFNGVIAISCPIDFDVTCMPKAAPLVAAIGHCEDVVSLGLTAGGRLRIQSGKFKAFIDCIEDPTEVHGRPTGDMVDIDGEVLLQAFRVLKPFIGSDASRPWVNGILLRGQSAFATNNVCLAEYWLGVDLPCTINIPQKAVDELLRVKAVPVRAQLCHHSVTFHYADGRWIRSQLYETNWPDLQKVLDRPSEPQPVPPGLFEGLSVIKPFVEKQGLVYFKDGALRTHQEDGLGAVYEVAGLHGEGVYHIGMLSLLDGAATAVDFTLYPQPLTFFGDRLRGAIVGLRG